MMLAPRYDGPTILTIAGTPSDQRKPFGTQRRRMLAMLKTLTDDQWKTPSRCDDWTVRDVVAHIVGVNSFWHSSIIAGLAGAPSRVLGGFFDPAATPGAMVEWMSALGSSEVLDQFIATSEQLLDTIDALTDEQWATLAEAPAGHVPIRLLVQHAHWDCWIHERDIVIPLGIAPTIDDDEVTSALRFAASISPALAIGLGTASPACLAVEAERPTIQFVLDVDESVLVSVRDEPTASRPCLRGDAVTLVEALSLRAPLPSSAPPEWSVLLNGLATAFGAADR
jgi:uncharacterized protein (TIGR03083 family)